MKIEPRPKLVRIDPSFCDCADCKSGKAKPFDKANEHNKADLLRGKLADHTKGEFGRSRQNRPQVTPFKRTPMRQR